MQQENKVIWTCSLISIADLFGAFIGTVSSKVSNSLYHEIRDQFKSFPKKSVKNLCKLVFS